MTQAGGEGQRKLGGDQGREIPLPLGARADPCAGTGGGGFVHKAPAQGREVAWKGRESLDLRMKGEALRTAGGTVFPQSALHNTLYKHHYLGKHRLHTITWIPPLQAFSELSLRTWRGSGKRFDL